MVVNAAIIVVAGGIAVLQRRPMWMKWQRWFTGSLLGIVGVELAIDAPAPATA